MEVVATPLVSPCRSGEATWGSCGDSVGGGLVWWQVRLAARAVRVCRVRPGCHSGSTTAAHRTQPPHTRDAKEERTEGLGNL